MTTEDFHDFEVVEPPGPPQEQTPASDPAVEPAQPTESILESADRTTVPPTPVSQVLEPTHATSPTQINTPNPNATSTLHTLAKLLILAALPIELAWTVLTTTITLEYLAFKTSRPVPTDRILEQIQVFIREDIDRCGRRLGGVDGWVVDAVRRYDLPDVFAWYETLRRACEEIVRSGTRTAQERLRGVDFQGPLVVATASTLKYCLLGMLLLGVYFLSPARCPRPTPRFDCGCHEYRLLLGGR